MKNRFLNVRHNVMNLTTIDAFFNTRGNVVKDVKNVSFVRFLGFDDVFVKNLYTIESSFPKNELYYCRVNDMPNILNYEDSNYYGICYEKWDRDKSIELLSLQSDAFLKEKLSFALGKVLDDFRKISGNVSSTMEKNFGAKLLFWFDKIASEPLKYNLDNFKFVFCNISKKQEYFFAYLITLMGADVLLLQTKGDIDVVLDDLKLSSKTIVGAFSNFILKPYNEILSQNLQNNDTENRSNVAGGEYRQEISTQNNAISNQFSSGQRAENAQRELQGNQSIGDISEIEVQSAQAGIVNSQQNIQNNAGVIESANRRQNAQRKVVDVRHPKREQEKQERLRREQEERVKKEQEEAQREFAQKEQERIERERLEQERKISQTNSFAATSAKNASRRVLEYEELANLASSIVMLACYDSKGNITSSGSGIMIGRAGYILTNNHVVRGNAYSYGVRIENDNRTYEVTDIIKYNQLLDLAIVRIDRELDPIPIYKEHQKLVRGQKVIAIGSPLGLFNSVSDGIISGFRKFDDVDMIQFTAPISPGSSGGAVLNMYGEVIGISTAGIDEGQNINLAVGYEYINQFVRGFV